MDEPQSCSSTLPPFLLKTYEMIEDTSTDTIVSWSPTDKSFIVWNPPEFAKDLLPKFFKHNNFSSFIRQLNTYGFRKIDPEHWEFANEDFIRGFPHLLKNIHRRKPIHSHSSHSQQGMCAQNCLTESERQGLQTKIERLKNDKQSLLIEMQKHERESADIILQMQSLKERLQESSQRQGNMESSLCQLLRPRLISSFLSQVDIHDRKRRLPLNDCRSDDTREEEHQIAVPPQAGGGYLSSIHTIIAPIIELQESLDSSLSFWENIVEEMCDSFFSEPFYLDESADDCGGSPSISYVQLDIESKSASIDMNCEPVSTSAQEPELTSSPKEESSVKQSFATPVRFNDVFWEQFLTENPGSDGVQEAQSERRDHSRNTKEGDSVDYRRMWWGIRNVNNPAEQMGKLTPAGTT